MLTHDQIERYWRLEDNLIEALPEISRSEDPNPACGPEEYECGCVTIPYVTSRGPGQRPFEMRLATACGGEKCETRIP